jgi:hypothetical protein
VLKQETRDDFLKRHLPYYDAVAYINAHLPDNATVFTMFLGRRGYYLERAYKNESSFGYDMIDKLVSSSVSEESFRKYIHTTGITHILMRTNFVENYLREYFSGEEKDRFMNLVKKCWKLEYSHNSYGVWNIG